MDGKIIAYVFLVILVIVAVRCAMSEIKEEKRKRQEQEEENAKERIRQRILARIEARKKRVGDEALRVYPEVLHTIQERAKRGDCRINLNVLFINHEREYRRDLCEELKELLEADGFSVDENYTVIW